MAKQEKEIERWVTVNGARVPIFKDGSIGGPKALRDKVQKKIDNDPANKTDHSMIEADNKKAEKESNIKKYKEKGSLRKQQENEIKKKVDNITGKNIKWLDYNIKQQGLGMESADMEDIKRDAKFMNGEKVSLYDKAGNEYRGTFNVYNDGGMEVVDIKKEWHNRKPTDTHSTGVEDDTKEKQISRNKKEADDRNNQVSDRVKSYQDKFLKKRSVEEIKEIQSNIEKGSKGIPMSSYDMVAMRAIENELKERNGSTKKAKVKNFESMNSVELSSIDLKKLSADEFSELHKIVKKKFPDMLGLRSKIIEESNRRFFEQSRRKKK